MTAYVCGPNSHYSTSMSPCEKTCMNLDMEEMLCALKPMEGCVCDEGYVLSDKKCVQLSECGCRDGLEYYPVEIVVLEEDNDFDVDDDDDFEDNTSGDHTEKHKSRPSIKN
ncbi:hypothetical protein KUTeg_013955 [Tegillarca granosa]|uniref:TIL domain-containing protein n=1 Tax=Tegillarca granosa TaxID=220873 RepID=A0ABQ9EV64_TEGGR|nr:hypothetical protein KUTeg_013955 [Tegillarca granosa]